MKVPTVNYQKMRSIRLSKPCLVASVALLLTCLPQKAAGVTWTKSLAEAKQTAAKKNFPIAVFWSDGTGGADTGSGKLSKKFVWLKLDKEKDASTLKAIGVDDYFTFGKMRSNDEGKHNAANGFVFMNSKGDIYSRLPTATPERGIDRMLIAVARRHYGPEGLYGSGADGQYHADGLPKELPGRITILPTPEKLHIWKDCKKCTAFIEKAMPYLSEKYPSNWYGGMLGGLTVVPAMIMYGKDDAKLKQHFTARAKHYYTAAPTTFGGYMNWFRAGNNLAMTEYALRFGLTTELETMMNDTQQGASEYIDDCQSWFHHPRKGGKNYSLEQGMIGVIFHASFAQMDFMGLQAEPGLSLARMACNRGSYGSAGGPGKNGLLVAGSYPVGLANDPFIQAWAQYQWGGKEPVQRHNPTGGIFPQWQHAYAPWHWMGTAIGLHRMGPAHYNDWAETWCHTLINLQLADGSTPKLENDTRTGTKGDPMKYVEHIRSKSSKGNWESTGVIASMILMTEPGAFYGVPIKPKGSLPNQKAFDAGKRAFSSRSYSKAYANFAIVLPPGNNLELVPQARIHMRELQKKLCPDRVERQKRARKIASFSAEKRAKGEIAIYGKTVHRNFKSRVTTRKARTIGPKRLAVLNAALLRTLVAISDKEALKAVPLYLSKSKTKVYLTKAESEGLLTFRIVNSKRTGTFDLKELTGRDHANLAKLVAELRPKSTDAQAMAGVYLEATGRVTTADRYFARSSPESRQKLEKLFDGAEHK
jgi:hypothetical protein